MTIATNILTFLHVLGAVMVVGIWIANFKKGITVPGQFYAALLQVITGFALYFIRISNMGNTSNTSFHMEAGIKILLGLIIMVAAYFGQKKYKAAISTGNPELGRNVALAHTVGGLGLINIAIATLLMNA